MSSSSSASSSKCPVDHSSKSAQDVQQPSGCPVDHASTHKSPSLAGGIDQCPVDHTGSSSSPSAISAATTWSRMFSSSPQHPTPTQTLSTEREVSSIPRPADGNWVYPSESQFFAAMERKNHNPTATDMKTVVPIHNAVNERAWAEILKWESGRGGEACGGVKLVNFKGKPAQRSPKATLKTFFGYSPPFDRHDWVVDRCGTRMRYVIDFYSGHNPNALGGNLSFYLDVRPALDNWDGVKMRVGRFWSSFFS